MTASANIRALERALEQGRFMVAFADRTIMFHTVADMRGALTELKKRTKKPRRRARRTARRAK